MARTDASVRIARAAASIASAGATDAWRPCPPMTIAMAPTMKGTSRSEWSSAAKLQLHAPSFDPLARQAGRGAFAGRSSRIAWTPSANQPSRKQMIATTSRAYTLVTPATNGNTEPAPISIAAPRDRTAVR